MAGKKKSPEDFALSGYRKSALEAARDLLYGDDVIRRIKNAVSVGEIERIMRGARTSGSRR